MPNNILKDFFYGNINPNEKQFDRNSEYGKAAAGLADEEEKLRSMLDQEAATVLDKMICLQAAIAGMTVRDIAATRQTNTAYALRARRSEGRL